MLPQAFAENTVPARLFHVAGDLVMPCWLLLLAMPRWRLTQYICTFAAPLLLAALYCWLLFAHPSPPGGGFSTLAGVAALFASPWALLAGWVHYLAFDLFLGAWQSRDAERHRISRWLVLPCQLLTLFFGPAGLACYLLLKLALRKRAGADEVSA